MRFQDNYHLDPIALGLRIRRARERKTLSQEELAVSLGVDQRAISELENGKRRLPITDVPDLARMLDVPLLYFFDMEASTDDFDIALLDEFHRLNKETKRAVIEVVRAISNMASA